MEGVLDTNSRGSRAGAMEEVLPPGGPYSHSTCECEPDELGTPLLCSLPTETYYLLVNRTIEC